MRTKMQALRDVFRNELFFVQVAIMYLCYAVFAGLIVGSFVATVGCVVNSPSGFAKDRTFIACMINEVDQLF